MSVRVRFAPSPTGPLHIGGVRTALYNYLFAKKNGGKFLLRIEDTDQTRYVPGAEEYIIESLNWCGLEFDEGVGKGGDFGPYRQSDRKHLYVDYAHQLVERGHAYYAFDSPEDLEAMREKLKAQGNPSPQYNSVTRQYMKNSTTLSADEVKSKLDAGDQYVVRIKFPRNEEIRFEDEIRGWVTFNTNQLDDKVLYKSDGMPTYHLANVVDDYLMKITHVIRGEEWLPSCPLHVFMYRSFGWENVMPKFAHLPLILRPDGNGKLSKRDGDRLGFPVFPLDWADPETKEKSSGYRELGFLPEALINFLAFIGWNPGTNEEIFSKEQLIELFSLDRIHKSGARFDFEKAKWFNHEYLKKKSDAELAEMVKPVLIGKNISVSEDYLIEVCRLMKERTHFPNEIFSLGYFFFEEVKDHDMKTVSKKWKENSKENFTQMISKFESVSNFSHYAIENAVKDFMTEKNLGMGDVLPLIRVMIAGTTQGPPVFEMMAVLGKEKVVSRMKNAIELFESTSVKN